MSSFIEQTLVPNEKLIYYTKPHWIIFAPAVSWIMLWLLISGLISYFNVEHTDFFGVHEIISVFNIATGIIVLVFAIIAYIKFISAEYGVTNRRVIYKLGLIRRDTLEILLDKIESIQVFQSVWGRIFNYGSIVISGTGGTRDVFDNIPSPLLFRQKAQIQMEERSGEDR